MSIPEGLTRQVERDTSSALGIPVAASTTIRARGHDDVCGYVGGNVRFESPGVNYTVSVGGCVTSIADRVVAIHWYGPVRGEAGVTALMSRTRRLALGMTGRPAN